MTESDAGKTGAGLIRRVWDFVTRPNAIYALGTLVGGGFVVGILFWGSFNWAMEMTNNETFCISCHEMDQNVFREYQNTIHYTNRSGVRATCPDCHVPKDWVHKMARKIQASNELFHHFVGTIDTREKFEAKRLQLANNVWRVMKETDSRECRNCHKFEFMDYTYQEPRAARRHQEGFNAGETCIDCHKGVAHRLPKGALEGQEQSSTN
jgi:cytochrome c-type protein NapC